MSVITAEISPDLSTSRIPADDNEHAAETFAALSIVLPADVATVADVRTKADLSLSTLNCAELVADNESADDLSRTEIPDVVIEPTIVAAEERITSTTRDVDIVTIDSSDVDASTVESLPPADSIDTIAVTDDALTTSRTAADVIEHGAEYADDLSTCLVPAVAVAAVNSTAIDLMTSRWPDADTDPTAEAVADLCNSEKPIPDDNSVPMRSTADERSMTASDGTTSPTDAMVAVTPTSAAAVNMFNAGMLNVIDTDPFGVTLSPNAPGSSVAFERAVSTLVATDRCVTCDAEAFSICSL